MIDEDMNNIAQIGNRTNIILIRGVESRLERFWTTTAKFLEVVDRKISCATLDRLSLSPHRNTLKGETKLSCCIIGTLDLYESVRNTNS